jgi:hypothetical protein
MACLWTLAPAANASTNFVTNGDFETLSATALNANSTMSTDGGFICATSGNTTCASNLEDWSSTCHAQSGSVPGGGSGFGCGATGTVASIIFAGTNGTAFNNHIGLYSAQNSPTGGNFIAIDGDPAYNASISQTIAGLTVGDTYSLSFDMAAAQQKGTTGNTLNGGLSLLAVRRRLQLSCPIHQGNFSPGCSRR